MKNYKYKILTINCLYFYRLFYIANIAQNKQK
jgi:hypothetical protein